MVAVAILLQSHGNSVARAFCAATTAVTVTLGSYYCKKHLHRIPKQEISRCVQFNSNIHEA